MTAITTEQTETGVSVTLHGQEGIDRFIAHAEMMVRPPHEARFGDDDFLPAPEVERIAERLIDRHERFSHLTEFTIVYLWKAKGGGSGGRARLGQCVKASGLARHFSEADFVIWLAADNVAGYGLSARQIEALVFHELMHANITVDKDDNIMPAIRGHEWEGFSAEIEEYGLWFEDLKRIGEAVQLRLPVGGAA